ncbi:MAG TPA: HIT family protein [Ferruginibacter sp.]|nr:HIT family protein [Ferruginibacter sp.]HRO95540.1 HIT family protein [Ferruginibacter sp.]
MTIFSKILSGEIPSYTIAQNEKFYAFLDVFPLVHGHVLVIPKLEVDKLYHLPDEFLSEMMLFAKPIALAIEKAFPCKRVGMSVIGLEVPHAHLHLIPLNTMDDINFTRKKLTVTREELLEAQQKIVHYLTGRDKR